MGRSRKAFIAIACIVTLAGIVLCGIVFRHVVRQQILEAEMEAAREEQHRIASAYVRLHYALLVGLDPEVHGNDIYRRHGIFLPFRGDDSWKERSNPIEVTAYLILRMYYHRTGILLTHETVVDYFSQEFEDDGSLRLYDNGNHPEIEAFVTWAWGERRRQEMLDYQDIIRNMYSQYFQSHRGEGFNLQNFLHLSPQMLDALARAEADPDYILDLTSLQQQGY